MKDLKHSKNIMQKTLMNLFHDIEYRAMDTDYKYNKEVCTNTIYTRLTVRYPFMKGELTYEYISEMNYVFEEYLNDKFTVNQYYRNMNKIINLLVYNFRKELYLD